MKKKVTSILLTLLFTFLLLAGCGSANKVALFDDDKANFIIVRSSDANATVKKSAMELRKKIKDNLDITVSYKPDTVKYKEDIMEVNIGITNRANAQGTYDEVLAANKNNGFDYAIRLKDNVIYIVGATDEALTNAVDYFYENFCVKKSASIEKDYYLKYHYEPKDNDFAICGSKDLSDYKIVTPQYNMTYLIGREITALRKAVLQATGSNVQELTDNNAETECEIIVGNVKREGIPQIADKDEYRITLSGKKLYVIGGSDEATAIAVKELTKMAEEGTEISENTDIKGSYSKTVKQYENYYSLTWADEFDTLNTDIWKPEKGTFTHASDIASDKKLRMVSGPENLYVEDGKLHMKVSQDENYYDSVELRTGGSLWYKYGLVECSSKFNISSGIATSFWLLALSGEQYHSEMDVFESQGAPNSKVKVTPISHVDKTTTGETMDVYYCGAIEGDDYIEAALHLGEGETFDDEFHTFGCEWDEKHVTFSIDGREFITMDTTVDERAKKTFNGLQQMLLTIYSGVNIGRDTGFPNETTDWENNGFVTDYVRLYQLPGQELRLK